MSADLSLLQRCVPEGYNESTIELNDLKMMTFIDERHLLIVTDRPMVINCDDLSFEDIEKPLKVDFSEMLSYSSKGLANMSHFSPYGDVVSMLAPHYPMKMVVFMPLGISCTRFPEKCFILTECRDLIGFGFNQTGTLMVCGERNCLKIYHRQKNIGA